MPGIGHAVRGVAPRNAVTTYSGGSAARRVAAAEASQFLSRERGRPARGRHRGGSRSRGTPGRGPRQLPSSGLGFGANHCGPVPVAELLAFRRSLLPAEPVTIVRPAPKLTSACSYSSLLVT